MLRKLIDHFRGCALTVIARGVEDLEGHLAFLACGLLQVENGICSFPFQVAIFSFRN
jgi:hypothetical protein